MNESPSLPSSQSAATPSHPASDVDSLFCPEVAELVAIAAAVAAHCEPCLRHHVREADRCGVSRADIDRAVALAAQVKQTPHRNILALAHRLTGTANDSSHGSRASQACCGQT